MKNSPISTLWIITHFFIDLAIISALVNQGLHQQMPLMFAVIILSLIRLWVYDLRVETKYSLNVSYTKNDPIEG